MSKQYATSDEETEFEREREGTPERGQVQEGARRRTDKPSAKKGTTEETSLPSVKREASSPEVTPPDWGGDDDSDVDPTAETPAHQEQEEASEAQWPWGPAGRPSDRRASAGHLAQKPSEPAGEPPPRHLNLLGAQKPNEPEGEPPSIRATAAEADASGVREGGRPRVSLTPNLRWQVQQVQQHMLVSRRKGGTTGSPRTEDQ